MRPRWEAGGGLTRKLVRLQFVCIVDGSKLVDGLGGSKLAMPVEIVQVRGLTEGGEGNRGG